MTMAGEVTLSIFKNKFNPKSLGRAPGCEGKDGQIGFWRLSPSPLEGLVHLSI